MSFSASMNGGYFSTPIEYCSYYETESSPRRIPNPWEFILLEWKQECYFCNHYIQIDTIFFKKIDVSLMAV